MMRKGFVPRWSLVAGLGAVWLLLAGTAGAYQFKDDAGKFAARFPAEPTLDKKEGSSVFGATVHYTWEVEIDDRYFSVTYTDYATRPVKNYDNHVVELLARSKGKLVQQAKVEQSGFDGLEVVTLLPDNKVMRQLMFLVGKRFYQVLYGGPAGTEAQADVQTFMKSFQLLK